MSELRPAFYRISEGQVHRVSEGELGEPGPLVCYLSLQDFYRLGPQLGVDVALAKELQQGAERMRSSVDVFEAYSVAIIDLLDISDVEGDRDRLLFLVTRDRFILVKLVDLDDSVSRLFEAALNRFGRNLTMEKVIYSVLERFLDGGSPMMEEIDHEILDLERRLVAGEVSKDFSQTIYDFRKRLTLMRNYYEQLVDIGEELEENENEIFEAEYLNYFRLFTSKAERLAAAAQMKSETLVHLREALDAELNYNINQVMRLFTVITAIFLPLTLIVGWYGMNFRNMPELDHPMGYPTVIIVSVVTVLLIVLWFKRRKLM